MIALILGGGRSGKSSYAERLALEATTNASRRYYIATGVAMDQEMTERIAKHQAARGESFVTIEEPHRLAQRLRELSGRADVVMIDCLTTWLGNLAYQEELSGSQEPYGEITDFLQVLKLGLPYDLLLVSNELGLGLIPATALARAFRDRAGRLNQQVAQLATSVVLMVAGLPLTIKDEAQPGRTRSCRGSD